MGDTGPELACIDLDGPAVFLKDDVLKLLKGKRVYFVGDSNMRAIYKDLIVLARDGKVCHPMHFKVKMEAQFKDDVLVDHVAEATKGRDYREVRVYQRNGLDITFAFVTKCWPNYWLKNFLNDVKSGKIPQPDLVIMCSMLWDISRYGPHGVENFKTSLKQLVVEVKKVLAPGTFLWLTQPPVGTTVTAAFLVQQLEFMSHLMRFHVMEANAYSSEVLAAEDIDVFDIHYYMCYVTDLRDVDATHWRPEGIRLILCLILTHVCRMWNIAPPRFRREQYETMKDVSYDDLMRSFLVLRSTAGRWPEWLETMIKENKEIEEHIASFGSSS